MSDAPPLSPVVALAVAEAQALRGRIADGSVVVALGSDELACAVHEAFPTALIRSFCDGIAATEPGPVTRLPLGPALFADARLVIAELPKTHAELDEWAALSATHGAPDVVFVGAGRDKHMSRGLNDQLAHAFTEVSASHGVRKARALRARDPRTTPTSPAYPRTNTVAGLPFAVTAHGGAFAGTKLDLGTRALLDVLDEAIAGVPVSTGLDLGCGTGVLATSLALAAPDAQVIASDVSWAAVASARATADGAGIGDRVRTIQQDGTRDLADASVDVVLFNPPFHSGHAVVEDMAHQLFAQAARVLRPGGVLVCVFNSHLPHRAALERLVGPTRQLSRTPKFTVTRSVKR